MNPIVKMKIKNRGTIILELYPESAPNSVNSFIYLINMGIFDTKEIKRIVKDFVIQPSYSNFDNKLADYSIEGEYEDNGFEYGSKLETGSLSLGGDGISKSSGSSFFIVIGKQAKRLIGKYPCLGKVIEGFEILEAIAKVKTKNVDVGLEHVEVNEPVVAEIIESITVDTYGIDFDEPLKI